MPARPKSFDPLKYAAGESARPGRLTPLRPTEILALFHAAVLYLWITWGFGGGSESMRPFLAWWGALGILLTLTVIQDRDSWKDGWMRPLTWLWPLLAFDGLAVLSFFNPSFRELVSDGEVVLVGRDAVSWLPSSARPQLTLQGLWYFNALWIPAFNVALLVRQRWALRGFLLLIVGNAFVLSIFGTLQKLASASGIYFGLVPTRQSFFFSTFVYHNHWGAFILLNIAACLGLTWHYARRHESRDFLHSPAFIGLVAVLILAATLPLSGSRSSTLLALLLLSGAFCHWLVRFIRTRRRYKESIALPLTGVLAAVIVAGAGIWYLARDVVMKRAETTRDQVSAMIERGGIGSRAEVYRNTWDMARARIWFGWGMGSYPHVFRIYNRQRSVDNLPVFYQDAHSDWLQSFAEHGLIGTALLGLCAVIPLLRVRRVHLASPVTAYLLAGCALILLYAWIEFPFGNLAVVLLWWLSCFIAVQYARLQDRESSTAVKPTAGASARSA